MTAFCDRASSVSNEAANCQTFFDSNKRKRFMKGKGNPLPEGFHTVTPRMFVRGAASAIEFYKQAFGAAELGGLADPSGKIIIAESKIGDSNISLSEESPE
jgi:PhnB protein